MNGMVLSKVNTKSFDARWSTVCFPFLLILNESRALDLGETVYSRSHELQLLLGPPGGGGGCYLTKFNTARLRPEVQPLTLSYTILAEKVNLFLYNSK